MRDYGRVFSSFWQSEDARALTDDGKMLALYLLTCPHANLIGCFRLPNAYAADDLKWSVERVSKGLNELSESGFIVQDEATKWVLIKKYILWNRFENGNVAIAAHKAYDQVPNIAIKTMLATALLDFGTFLKEPFVKALETVKQPFANPILNLNPNPSHPEPNQNQNPTIPLIVEPLAGDTPKPKKPAAKKEPTPTAETWNAYAAAYERRYRVPPVRNTAVNGQLSQLVSRLGAGEAPQVAAWYVNHQNQFYVGGGHSVGLLLRDCEKLRTQWATGRQVTATQALQADKTQTNLSAFSSMIEEAKGREHAVS